MTKHLCNIQKKNNKHVIRSLFKVAAPKRRQNQHYQFESILKTRYQQQKK